MPYLIDDEHHDGLDVAADAEADSGAQTDQQLIIEIVLFSENIGSGCHGYVEAAYDRGR